MPSQAQSFAALAELFGEGDLIAALRDEDGLAAFRETLAAITTPDLEVVMSGPGGFSSTFRGVDGFVEGWRDWHRIEFHLDRAMALRAAGLDP